MGRSDTVVTDPRGLFGTLSNVPRCGRALVAFVALSFATSAIGGINQWTVIGPAGGDVGNLVITAGTPARTYALAGAIYQLDDAGPSWSRPGTPQTVNTIAAHPVNSNLLFITVSSRVIASRDGGVTRVDITPPATTSPFINAIVSQDGTMLYAVNIAGIIYRSTDLGTTWSAGSNPRSNLRSLHPDPANANRLLAVLNADAGASLSNDGGNSWTPLPLPTGTTAVNAVAFSSSGTPRLWLATPEGLWHTSDDGANWSATALTGAVQAVAVNPGNSSSVLAQKDSLVYRSEDAGAQWTPVNGTSGVRRVSAFVFDPLTPNRVFIAGSPGVWVSVDGGANWSALTQGMNATSASHFSSSMERTYFAVNDAMYYLEAGASVPVAVDNTALRAALRPYAPGMDALITVHSERYISASQRLFAGGLGGGLARSMDGGQTWSRLTHPLLNTRVFGLERSVQGNYIFAATSNGILLSADGGDTWNTSNGINANVTLLSENYAVAGGSLYKTADNGLNWAPVTTTGIDGGSISSLYEFLLNTTYAGTNDGAFRTTDGGASWTRLPVSGTGPFWVDGGPTGVYVTRREGVVRSHDEGNTWTEVTSLPAGVTVTELYLDPNPGGRLLAATQANGVYEYTMGADLTMTATSLPPTTAGRVKFQFTITNRGPHAASGLEVKLNGGSHFLYINPFCRTDPDMTFVTSGRALKCQIPNLASGAAQAMEIEAGFTGGPIEITASVTEAETELAAADNTIVYRESGGPPDGFVAVHGSDNGGGGAISWWMLFGFAGALARITSRREKLFQACGVGRIAADSHRAAC